MGTRARTRAVRAALEATSLVGNAAAGAGTQRIRPAAVAMATMQGLDQLVITHTQFRTLEANAQAEWMRERRSYKPVVGPSFSQAPGIIDIFAIVYEIVRKLTDLLSSGRFFWSAGGPRCVLHSQCI